MTDKLTANSNCLKKDDDNIAILLDSIPQLDMLFSLSHCIGHGTFSSVYLGKTKHDTTINGEKYFAVKHIIPTSHPSRIYMELKCLKMIGGTDSVMGITLCFRQLNHIVLVMPHFSHDPFHDYVGTLNEMELRDYLWNLLIALRRVHSFGVIHRDVKPANFLYCRKERRYALIDFGLAQEVLSQNKKFNTVFDGVSQTLLSFDRSETKDPKSRCHDPNSMIAQFTVSKSVKRKLTDLEISENGNVKRCCTSSPPQVTISSVLSTTTNCSNLAVRRSPRKHASTASWQMKENHENARRQQNASMIEKDVHLKELLRMNSQNIVGTELPANFTVRRSPRKLANASTKAHWEVLAKYLQEKTKPVFLSATTNGNNSTVCPTPAPTPSVDASPQASAGVQTLSLEKQINAQISKRSLSRPFTCHCYGGARICGTCTSRPQQVAPRAGTPGFRAPEVLLRHPYQGTAVDMWSVGVMLLCLLSGRYPFFRASDDLTTLAEISTLLGTQVMRKVAYKLEKLFSCSRECPPLDLQKVCCLLRSSALRDDYKTSGIHVCTKCCQGSVCVCTSVATSTVGKVSGGSKCTGQSVPPQRKKDAKSSVAWLDAAIKQDSLNANHIKTISNGDIGKNDAAKLPASYPASIYSLLICLLDVNPETRITADNALKHPFFVGH